MVRELPAIDWLGYGIDLSGSPTMDLRAASKSVIKGRRLIDFDTDNNLRPVDINGNVYDVPEVVRIAQEAWYQGSFTSYLTGDEAQKAFRADPGLPARYFAVTGADTSIAFAHDRPFVAGNQYALYSYTQFVYAARLADYIDFLNETSLLRGVEELPRPFNGSDKTVLEAYKDFFLRYGSHVIVNVNYGARFQLNAWASNDNASVNAKFATDVKAFFNGIPSGGEYDEGVKSEAQYKIFLEYLQRIVTVMGGDTSYSISLTSDPTDWETYSKWLGSVPMGTPTHISFHTTALWTLMSAYGDSTLKPYAEELDRAFTWILTHPRVYKTIIVFDIQSDWAEFNLLTPNARILPDDANPFPPGTVSSLSRVQWGKEYSHDYQRQTLRFVVVNDGSPIDFSISHGTHGAQPRQGLAEALIESKRYRNDAITDDVWNTMWFFGAPVSATPETFQLEMEQGYAWDDICGAYLQSAAKLATD